MVGPVDVESFWKACVLQRLLLHQHAWEVFNLEQVAVSMLAAAAVGLARSRKALHVDLQTASARQEPGQPVRVGKAVRTAPNPASSTPVTRQPCSLTEQMVCLAGALRYVCRSRLGVQSNSVLIPKKNAFRSRES